ncbi:hypothetical protein DNTS_031796 [Danionella cerebrum]|uniref:C2H2-type domain-containing protein n=1 Tax=Danionella cerebrum TaxID=2873325 RepID=A0A553QCR3_9TELE|nr:hypothetical protein DNTS_031796 [Danionella translucida]
MADEEAEQERSESTDSSSALTALATRLESLTEAFNNSPEAAEERAAQYCYEFCQALLAYSSLFRVEEDPLPLLEGYTTALLSFAKASSSSSSPLLSPPSAEAPVLLERLSLSCVELLLSLPGNIEDAQWDRFTASVQIAVALVREHGLDSLSLLSSITQGPGVWTHPTLQDILTQKPSTQEAVCEFLSLEGPALLRLRIKQLLKQSRVSEGASLAQACANFFQENESFRQMQLVCVCSGATPAQILEQLSSVDCADALEMICNLEADGDEESAFTLCSGFLTRQILLEEAYCSWELTLFWGKLLKRLEPNESSFLEKCHQMSLLCKTVFHLLFFIKVIQSEMDKAGLSTCVEICVQALRLNCEGSTKATVCKTISCLLPSDLEVKRACQLTQFLSEPNVDAYYAMEALYNEPDQKLDVEELPVSNSLRCELLLVLKTQWPFDPEFWNWKALKRHCLGLMGEEASIVSSIDELNDGDLDDTLSESFRDASEQFLDASIELSELSDQKQKNRELKKLREKGFVSTRFRNWQAYMQYCVLCDKEFLGHRIVKHAQTHCKDGCFTCPICMETFETKETLRPHVTAHVKLSCKERLAAMKTSRQLATPKTAAPHLVAIKAQSNGSQLRKSKIKNGRAGQSKLNPSESLDITESSEGNICPVQGCRKGFKYFRNLVAHVKDHGDNEEAKRFLEMQRTKVVCQYCRRQFVSVDHLNDHLQMHCGIKPYICIQLNCKASFDSNSELMLHKKAHLMFKARCMFPGCGKIFHEAYKLYDHEAQHYKTFTCRAPDCGKVFHSQSELDLHVETHVAKRENQVNEAPSEEPPVDHINTMDQSATASDLIDNSTEFLADRPPGLVIVKHSVENMLNDAFATSADEHVHSENLKTEHSPSHQQLPSINDQPKQLSPSRTHHTNQHRPEESLLEALMSDSGPIPSTSLYQSEDILPTPTTNDPLPVSTSNDPNSSSQNGAFPQFNPAVLGPAQTPYQSMCSSTTRPPAQDSGTPLISLGQMLPPVSQSLPMQITSISNNAQVFEDKCGKVVDTALVQVKERHKCPHENCTRDYSSYRSVTKHMKAVHPDFYTQWMLVKKNNAVQSKLRNVSMNLGHSLAFSPRPQTGHRFPSVLTPGSHDQPPSHQSNCANPNYLPGPSHMPQSNHNHASETESILDPIVNCPLRKDADQSQESVNHIWDSRNEAVLEKQSYHSHNGRQSMNMQAGDHFTHIKATSSAKEAHHREGKFHPVSSQANMGQNGSDASNKGLCCAVGPAAQGLGPNMAVPVHSEAKTKLGPEQLPMWSSYSGKGKTVTIKDSPRTFLPQTKTDSYPAVLNAHHAEQAPGLAVENSDAPLSNGSSRSSLLNSGDKPEVEKKKVKRSSRTKWPAIVRDGKFLCCRCYREFASPKSLGGHLSKRVICKQVEEADLSADLPSSFLDLLNSPHPTTLTNVGLPHIKGPLDPKLFPNVSFPQANGETNSSTDKAMVGIVKKTQATSCVSSALEQQTNPAHHAPYTQSVIQHTGSLKQLAPGQPELPNPMLSDGVSEHLLSQLLMNNQSSSSLSSSSSDHDSQVTPNETLIKPTNKSRESSELYNASELSNEGLLAAMATLTQNIMSEKSVKERLREQILAGDFQKKGSLPHGSSMDSSCSQTSATSSVSGEPQCAPNLVQCTAGSEPQPLKNTPISPVSQMVGGSLKDSMVVSGSGLPQNSVHVQPCGVPTIKDDEVLQIQKALEKLDLNREIHEVNCEITVESHGTYIIQPRMPKPSVPAVVKQITPKPFMCKADDCTFSAMTKEGLFNHLVKLHNYTEEQLAQMKDQFNVSPFICVKCSKSFTRNSNLKAHYVTIHKISREDLKKIKSLQESNASSFVEPQTPSLLKKAPGNYMNPLQMGKNQNKKSKCTLPSLVHHLASQDGYPPLKTPIQQSVIVPNHSPFAQATKGLFPNKVFGPGKTHASALKEIPPMATLNHNATEIAQTFNQPINRKPKPQASKAVKLTSAKLTSKKPKEKKSDMDDPNSPYRPYRCVHLGCVAAFTIQQNLILHYKAVHQSDLSKFQMNSLDDQTEVETEEDMNRNEETEGKLDTERDEFRCQVKDCSCIFQLVPDLLQHYIQLHKLPLKEAGAMMCKIRLGRFQCDQPNCSETFTAFWKYMSHLDKDHKQTIPLKVDIVDGFFRCPVEGCEGKYSSRSNLLRHTMLKHPDTYRKLLMNPKRLKPGVKLRRFGAKLGRPKKTECKRIEKENQEACRKPVKKVSLKKKKVTKNCWTKYGKPTLKTQDEASAMCTKALQLQYPCMIKGCETVTGSERNIMKHYLQHGLPKQYLEEQRSNFIYCKKRPRSRYKHINSRSDDTDKSEESSMETTENEDAVERGPSEVELSKRMSGKDRSVCKPPMDTCSGTSVVVKRRRGRPRKCEKLPVAPKRMIRRRTVRSPTISYADLTSDSTSSSTTFTQETSGCNTALSSFKPMGFEVSFLQFLQESNAPKKRKPKVPLKVKGIKRMSIYNLKTATVVCKRADAELPLREASLHLVEFKNPQKLKSLANVTFEVQRVFSSVLETLLKQLHEMRPAVILQKKK